jgi:O-acetyl-ADP-ribose deacetylase (regulator of RNase III)
VAISLGRKIYARTQGHNSTFFFTAAVLEIKSLVLSTFNRNQNDNGNQKNVATTEKADGTFELSLGSSGLTIQIVCADIANETTDLIMHVVTQDFSLHGGVAKALVRDGGKSILQECQALAKPAPFTTQYTKAGNLAVRLIAHVIVPGSTTIADLQKCLSGFFDDVSARNIASISFSAVGAGAMGFSESQSAELIFDNLFRISENKNSFLKLVRIVIFEKPKFLRFKDAAEIHCLAQDFGSVCSEEPESIEKRDASIKIYSDDRDKIVSVWKRLQKKMNENVREKTMTDNIIKKFTDRDLQKLSKLEREFDIEITIDRRAGEVRFKGHIRDMANVQGKISEILNDIKENKGKGKIKNFWS